MRNTVSKPDSATAAHKPHAVFVNGCIRHNHAHSYPYSRGCLHTTAESTGYNRNGLGLKAWRLYYLTLYWQTKLVGPISEVVPSSSTSWNNGQWVTGTFSFYLRDNQLRFHICAASISPNGSFPQAMNLIFQRSIRFTVELYIGFLYAHCADTCTASPATSITSAGHLLKQVDLHWHRIGTQSL